MSDTIAPSEAPPEVKMQTETIQRVAQLGDAVLAAFGTADVVDGHDVRTFSWQDDVRRTFTLRQDRLLQRDTEWQDMVRVTVAEPRDSRGVEFWFNPETNQYGASVGSNIAALRRIRDQGDPLEQLETSLLDAAIARLYGYALARFCLDALPIGTVAKGARPIFNGKVRYQRGGWTTDLAGFAEPVAGREFLTATLRWGFSSDTSRISSFVISPGQLEATSVVVTEHMPANTSGQVARLLGVMAGDSFVDRQQMRRERVQKARKREADERARKSIASESTMNDIKSSSDILIKDDPTLELFCVTQGSRTIVRFMTNLLPMGADKPYPHAIAVEVIPSGLTIEAIGLTNDGTTGRRFTGSLSFYVRDTRIREVQDVTQIAEQIGEPAALWVRSILLRFTTALGAGQAQILPEDRWDLFFSYTAKTVGKTPKAPAGSDGSTS